MSINVNVTGSPVSIRRGKIVTADPDYAKKEFQQRRRIRLAQVRQQSKDIAENVRNKVRNEKSKQLSELEKKGEKELKKWQARKLLALQQQYQVCLKDIGLGHKQATLEVESDNAVELQKEGYDQIAKERGAQAKQRQQNKRQREQEHSLSSFQNRMHNRAVEDTRSMLISNLNKKKHSNLLNNLNKKKHTSPFKKKKRKKMDKSISSTKFTSECESETEVPEFLNLSSSGGSSSSRTYTNKSENENDEEYRSQTTITQKSSQEDLERVQTRLRAANKVYDEDVKRRGEKRYTPSPPRPMFREYFRKTIESYPVDTRISDRIKRRTVNKVINEPETSNCDSIPDVHVQHKAPIVHEHRVLQSKTNPERNRTDSPKRTNPEMNRIGSPKRTNPEYNRMSSPERTSAKVNRVSSPKTTSNPERNRMCSPKKYSSPTKHNTNEVKEGLKHNPQQTDGFKVKYSGYDKNIQIPNKPTVTVRTAVNPKHNQKASEALISESSNLNKVQYYDHKNRYFKEYIPDNFSVRKIDVDSIDVCPSSGSSVVEYEKRMYRRDQEAELRGQKALRKEKIHRDYKEMMQQLPVLQKQERLASIPSHKAIFHMSEDRLKEYEKKKQNRMEDAYEKLFPKANIITLPSKGHPQRTSNILPHQSINFKNNPPILNVASWDVESKQQKSLPVMVPKNVDSELIREAMKQVPLATNNVESVSQRREYLQELLSTITYQRNKLVNELALLPENSNLRNLFGDIENIDGLIKVGESLSKSGSNKRQERKPDGKRSKKGSSLSQSSRINKEVPRNQSPQGRINKEVSRNQSPQERIIKEVPRNRSPQRRINKKVPRYLSPPGKGSIYHAHCVSEDSSTSPSPAPKIITTKKKKPSPVALQTISTQTTPTVEKDSKIAQASQTRDKEVGLPDCCKSTKMKEDDMCEIIIKIDNDGKPKICLSPTKLKDKKIIVKTCSGMEATPLLQMRPEIVKPKQPVVPQPQQPQLRVCENQAPPHQPAHRSNQQPTRGSNQPACESNQPAHGSKQPAHGSKQPAHGSKQPARGSKQPARESNQPALGVSQPVQGFNQPKPVEKEKSAHKGQQKPCPVPTTCCKKESGGVSWREYLSQNSTNSSNTTSYYSPPDFTSTAYNSYPKSVGTKQSAYRSGGHLTNILRDRPQQNNVPHAEDRSRKAPNTSRPLNPNLLQCVRRLLAMSRTNIDDLGVSSASEISTPGSSIINMQSNQAKQQIYNAMKHFNVDLCDIEHYLSYSPDGSNIHYNTTESGASSSRSGDLRNNAGAAYYNTLQQMPSEDVRNVTLDDYCAENYPGILLAYNQLAENCAKRIENLAAMIEKVRLDKLNMLQSPGGSGSDKENSTKYLDLPSEFIKSMEQEKRTSISSGPSIGQEELDRQMLEVDYNFTGKSKMTAPGEIHEKLPLVSIESLPEEDDQERDELMERYKNLLESHKIPVETQTESADANININIEFEMENELAASNRFEAEEDYEPLLGDIPRLPKYTVTDVTTLFSNNCKCSDKSKPPTSKGLSIARRYNNNISLVPHELSTILEMEASRTQASRASESRQSSRNASPSEKANVVTNKDMVPIVFLDANYLKRMDDEISVSPKISSESLPDILTELKDDASELENVKNKSKGENQRTETSKQVISSVSGDSSPGELENMETVLKSLGMGWAIATLRKTQEALALTSSSSSIDISLKQKITDSSSTVGEVSIRDILGKQILTKLSSSTSSTNTSPFMKELQDLSAIQGSGGTSYEKTTQRTSTPIQSSKTDDKSRNDSQPHVILTAESELSSVKANSENNDCVSFYSLNEESSIKSKSGTKSN